MEGITSDYEAGSRTSNLPASGAYYDEEINERKQSRFS